MRAVEQRAPANTLTAVQRDLQRLLEIAAEYHVHTVQAIDVHLLRRFVARRRKLGIAARSVQRELSSVRAFLRALCRSGELAANPAEQLRAPKGPRKLPSAFDREPLLAALDQSTPALPPRADVHLHRRDVALAELFYSSGLRLAEVQTLTLGQFDSAFGEVRVTGKGGKTRIAPVGEPARDALQQWLALRPHYARDSAGADAPVFVGRDGRAMSRGAIQQRIKTWAQRSGLAGRVHPHRFRHAFATHLLEESGDLRAVQELLGHANLATTQIYTHLDFDRLSRVYDAAHPLAQNRREKENVAKQHDDGDKMHN